MPTVNSHSALHEKWKASEGISVLNEKVRKESRGRAKREKGFLEVGAARRGTGIVRQEVAWCRKATPEGSGSWPKTNKFTTYGNTFVLKKNVAAPHHVT